MGHPEPIPDFDRIKELPAEGLKLLETPTPERGVRGYVGATIAVTICILVSCLAVVATAYSVQTLRVTPPMPVPASPFAPIDPNVLDERFSRLMIIEANTLTRLKDIEADMQQHKNRVKMLDSSNRDVQLRLEMMSRDFKRMPDTGPSQPGFPDE